MKSDKLIYYVLMFSFVVGFIAIIGIWYLFLLLVAGVIFFVVLFAVNRQRSQPLQVMSLNPRLRIPLEEWVSSRDAPIATGSNLVDFRLVNYSEYSENWANFRIRAQISAGETVRVETTLYCINDNASGQPKIVIAHDREVLAEFASVDLEGVFKPLARAGGVFRIPCEFKFSKDGTLEQALAFIQTDIDPSHDPDAPVDLLNLWTMIWRGIRGKS